MASVLKVDKLDPQSGTALEIGTSGDTITVPTGAGLTVTDEVKTNKVSPATGTAFALGDSGDTFTVPSGATIVNSGTATGFGITQANFLPNANPLIINGNMAISQRGTSFAAVGASDYTLDRYEMNQTMDSVVTITQEALTSGNAYADGFKTALKCDVTTADATLTGSQKLLVQNTIEAQDLQSLKFGTANAEKLTLSFWVKATKTGINIIRMYAPDDNRSCSQSYTVDSTDTWEKKVVNFPVDTTGVIDNNNGAGIMVAWCIAAGPDQQSGTLATAWATQASANDFVGQVNNVDSTSNNFHFTGVQLEVGEYTSTDLPPFRHESYGDSLARCHRYYYFLASEATNGGTDTTLCVTMQYNTSSMTAVIPFPITMRTKPSIDQLTGTNMYRVYENGSNATMDSLTLSAGGTNNFAVVSNGTSITVTSGSAGNLQTMDGTASVAFDAEL